MRADGLWEDTSASERALFEQHVRNISVQQRIGAMWRAESIQCLVWALGLIDALPPYDTKPDVEKILALIPYLTAEEWGLIRSITMERHFALNWLCGYAPNNEWDDTPTPT